MQWNLVSKNVSYVELGLCENTEHTIVYRFHADMQVIAHKIIKMYVYTYLEHNLLCFYQVYMTSYSLLFYQLFQTSSAL